MSTKILFMCPHNAAKSVLAMAYAQQYADKHPEQELSFISAGTEPGETHSKAVVTYLGEKNLALPALMPRLVSQADLDEADLVISMGCDLSNFEMPAEKMQEWAAMTDSDVDLDTAVSEISSKVEKLLAEL
jgi:arsenate reductase